MSAKELARKIQKKLKFANITLEQVEAVLFVIKEEHLEEIYPLLQEEKYKDLQELEIRLRNSGM